MVFSGLILIWLASLLDYILGDPWGWLHPVQVIGWFISVGHNFIIRTVSGKLIRKIAGVILGLTLVVGSGLITWFLINSIANINFYWANILQVILLASCFAGKSLRQAAEDVLQHLRSDNIQQARYRLGFYVGRDTDNLSVREIYRAILETVTENATDGVTAPLFYALLGLVIPGIGCVPLTMAYKTASTLDSMIGYRQEPFIDVGWFSAKLEDCLTWFPCRLTVLSLAIGKGNTIETIKICRQYARQDSSPNSGWSESIYAVILGVQLGGVNFYGGEEKIKPLLGTPTNVIEEATIYQALSLTRYCCLSWLIIVSTIVYGQQLYQILWPKIYGITIIVTNLLIDATQA